VDLPSQFVEKVHRIFGHAGREWLPSLPGILAQCEANWELSAFLPCPHMSMNYIAYVTTADGTPAVLKVGVPHPELFTEMEALALYRGRGAVRLLNADRELGAILMQRVQPGTMLWQLGDNRRETEIAASLMAALPVPVPPDHHLPTFARWVSRAFRLTRTEWDPQQRMPRDLLGKAEQAFQEIERRVDEQVVLHGDLHHENILFDRDAGWTVIDPKGVIGPACLEVGRFLQNQLPGGSRPAHRLHSASGRPPGLGSESQRREEMVRERVEILGARLNLSKELIVASGLVDCVLSHCWSFEDGGLGESWYEGIELARLLCSMLGA
jgi:streptomycin 6-kinase